MTSFDSLAGLSVGDAFGAQFFVTANRPLLLDETALPAAPWPWTDDTEMACNLLDVLWRYGQVERDSLAAAFAGRYDPYRGYGPGTVVLLRALREGESWRTAAPAMFDGRGSMGNGAAMRVAPLTGRTDLRGGRRGHRHHRRDHGRHRRGAHRCGRHPGRVAGRTRAPARVAPQHAGLSPGAPVPPVPCAGPTARPLTAPPGERTSAVRSHSRGVRVQSGEGTRLVEERAS
jgi:hypothetical protein